MSSERANVKHIESPIPRIARMPKEKKPTATIPEDEGSPMVERLRLALREVEDPVRLASMRERALLFSEADAKVDLIEENILQRTGQTAYEIADEGKGMIGRMKGWWREQNDPKLAKLMRDWRTAMAEWNAFGEEAGAFGDSIGIEGRDSVEEEIEQEAASAMERKNLLQTRRKQKKLVKKHRGDKAKAAEEAFFGTDDAL